MWLKLQYGFHFSKNSSKDFFIYSKNKHQITFGNNFEYK